MSYLKKLEFGASENKSGKFTLCIYNFDRLVDVAKFSEELEYLIQFVNEKDWIGFVKNRERLFDRFWKTK